MFNEKPYKLLTGDSATKLKELPSESVDLTVTSPPYDNLREYKGYSFDFEGIAKELFRVTKKGGVVVWVVGDATVNGSETGTSFKQALYFKEIGFGLETMIYQKNNGAFGSPYLYHQVFEFMFILFKGEKPYTSNLIQDRKNVRSGYETAVRRGRGVLGKPQPTRKNVELKEQGKRKNIWDYAVGLNGTTSDTYAFQHPAIFPEALARDHIVSWSNEGDTVLDCFLGSGTTGKMAMILKRKFIGIEIAPEYMEIAEARIKRANLEPCDIPKRQAENVSAPLFEGLS